MVSPRAEGATIVHGVIASPRLRASLVESSPRARATAITPELIVIVPELIIAKEATSRAIAATTPGRLLGILPVVLEPLRATIALAIIVAIIAWLKITLVLPATKGSRSRWLLSISHLEYLPAVTPSSTQ